MLRDWHCPNAEFPIVHQSQAPFVSCTHSAHWSYAAHGEPGGGVGAGVGTSGTAVGAGVGGCGIGQMPRGATLTTLLQGTLLSRQLVPQKRHRSRATHCEHMLLKLAHGRAGVGIGDGGLVGHAPVLIRLGKLTPHAVDAVEQ
jgi:hypothetical protein